MFDKYLFISYMSLLHVTLNLYLLFDIAPPITLNKSYSIQGKCRLYSLRCLSPYRRDHGSSVPSWELSLLVSILWRWRLALRFVDFFACLFFLRSPSLSPSSVASLSSLVFFLCLCSFTPFCLRARALSPSSLASLSSLVFVLCLWSFTPFFACLSWLARWILRFPLLLCVYCLSCLVFRLFYLGAQLDFVCTVGSDSVGIHYLVPLL